MVKRGESIFEAGRRDAAARPSLGKRLRQSFWRGWREGRVEHKTPAGKIYRILWWMWFVGAIVSAADLFHRIPESRRNSSASIAAAALALGWPLVWAGVEADELWNHPAPDSARSLKTEASPI